MEIMLPKTIVKRIDDIILVNFYSQKMDEYWPIIAKGVLLIKEGIGWVNYLLCFQISQSEECRFEYTYVWLYEVWLLEIGWYLWQPLHRQL